MTRRVLAGMQAGLSALAPLLVQRGCSACRLPGQPRRALWVPYVPELQGDLPIHLQQSDPVILSTRKAMQGEADKHIPDSFAMMRQAHCHPATIHSCCVQCATDPCMGKAHPPGPCDAWTA